MVELVNVSLFYQVGYKKQVEALSRVNASFKEGEFSVVIGPSGCGKTSLLKLICGLLTPTQGYILVAGKPLTGISRQTAVIFQDYGLLPWKTVENNAKLPLKIGARRHFNAKDFQKVDRLLDEFGLCKFKKFYPHELSGGMKQRLAIVRSLASEPELLLMDEAFSSLDALSRENAQDFLLSMQNERRLTVIMATHSVEEAVYLADTVYLLSGVNPGTITSSMEIKRDESIPRFRFKEQIGFLEYSAALRCAMQKKLPEAGEPS
jgi:NitT/TauT family transport system ATP-binding protein